MLDRMMRTYECVQRWALPTLLPMSELLRAMSHKEMQMGTVCFLNLYEECIPESGMNNPAPDSGTKTFTETRESPDQDIGMAAAATETFTRMREEPDQDRGTTQYMGIPRIAE